MGGDLDPISKRCCGFIQSLHKRRYVWSMGSGFCDVLWFYSVPLPTTILMEPGIRCLWVFVVLFSPSTNDGTYRAWDPVSVIFVVLFSPSTNDITILMELGIRFLWCFVVLFSPSTNDDTYGKKTIFVLFQVITQAYRSFKCLSVWLECCLDDQQIGVSSRLCPD